ncbi:MAG: transposase [Acidobacteriota bacterium]|nr:transposase [Acidobacteriota bacterium]
MARRPPRLTEFDYTGLHTYFLTACTHQRQKAFAFPRFAAPATDQLLQLAQLNRFAVLAYCLMPDHVHAQIAAQATSANARTFFNRWRQWTGFRWKQLRGFPLWQDGYWDYVLRQDEEPFRISAYIGNNPVRARLVSTVLEYPYIGSSEYSLPHLAEAARTSLTEPRWRHGRRQHGRD